MLSHVLSSREPLRGVFEAVVQGPVDRRLELDSLDIPFRDILVLASGLPVQL